MTTTRLTSYHRKLIEPSHTGISYSFTNDGHYEEAYYRAIANPQNPRCPSAIMQWQHGTYTYNANGSLSLKPIAVDGRQLLSSPCQGENSVYTRYNQSELFQVCEMYGRGKGRVMARWMRGFLLLCPSRDVAHTTASITPYPDARPVSILLLSPY